MGSCVQKCEMSHSEMEKTTGCGDILKSCFFNMTWCVKNVAQQSQRHQFKKQNKPQLCTSCLNNNHAKFDTQLNPTCRPLCSDAGCPPSKNMTL